MSQTISPTGGKQKIFHGQFSISLTLLERMYLDYYGEMYNKDRGEILRGMLHKYVQLDDNFEPEAFVKWAEKSFVPREPDKDVRKQCKERLEAYKSANAATMSEGKKKAK